MRLTLRHWLLASLALAPAGPASAFMVNIANGPQEIYLRVGTGSSTGNYKTGGVMLNNATINTVAVDVPVAEIGSGNPQLMAGDSGQGASHYDGALVCLDPGMIYIGGYYRKPNSGGADALLTSNSPAFLVSELGETIPISQISWTASDRAKPRREVILSGIFAPGTQTLEVFRPNRWQESCHSFYYANSAPYPAGEYRARIVYTLSAP